MLTRKYAPRIGVALTALFALILAGAFSAQADDAISIAKWRSCKDVVVQFDPEGSGGGTDVQAKRVSCARARRTLRSCINGELKKGWSGNFRDPKFVLRKKRKRIRFLLVGGGGCVPLSRAAKGSEGDKPAPPNGADRVEAFRPDLNRDGVKERILVYNLPKNGLPVTYFEVWKRKHGTWKRKQRQLVTESPGNELSGLVEAWVGDLNRDGRVEIAVRDSITPSVGEVLSIYRQKSKTSAHFADLQSVGGDTVGVRTRKKKAAVLEAFLKSNHSPDNIEHHEVWKWSKAADAWRCRDDCAVLSRR
jgi:hypothetical protein